MQYLSLSVMEELSVAELTWVTGGIAPAHGSIIVQAQMDGGV